MTTEILAAYEKMAIQTTIQATIFVGIMVIVLIVGLRIIRKQEKALC